MQLVLLVASSIDSSVDSGWSRGLDIYGSHVLVTLLAYNAGLDSHSLLLSANQKQSWNTTHGHTFCDSSTVGVIHEVEPHVMKLLLSNHIGLASQSTRNATTQLSHTLVN